MSETRARENLLLAALPKAEWDRLDPFLEWVEMQAGQPITEPDKPILNLYFPFDAVTSTTQEMGNGSSSKRRPKYQTTVFTGMENTTPHVSPSTAARRIPGTNSGKPTAG
jgi:hypothetical protein